MSATKLSQPHLSILLGALESRPKANSIPELGRLPIKLFDTQLMAISEAILQMEHDGMTSVGPNPAEPDAGAEIADACLWMAMAKYTSFVAHTRRKRQEMSRTRIS